MVILKCIFLFLFATAVTVAQKTTTEKPIEIVTVCEVINNRSFYNGKVLAVVGSYYGGYHGRWLSDECTNQIRTGNHVWDNSIWMEYDSSSKTSFPNGVKFDDSIVKKKIAEMKQRLKPSDEKVQWAIVFGQIETKEELEIGYALDGKSINPFGYGHLNESPAQIVFKEKDTKFFSTTRLGHY